MYIFRNIEVDRFLFLFLQWFDRFIFRDDSRAVSSTKRWVPPSVVRRNALSHETYKNDIIFRKVNYFRKVNCLFCLNFYLFIVVSVFLLVEIVSWTSLNFFKDRWKKSKIINLKFSEFWQGTQTSLVIFFLLNGNLKKVIKLYYIKIVHLT